MKSPHLIALAAALAVTGSSHAATIWTTTFSGTDNTARALANTASGPFTDVLTSTYALTFNISTPTTPFRTGSGNPATNFNPDKNVDNAAGAGWNCVFDYNGGTQAIELNAVTFNILRFNSSGVTQGFDTTARNVNISAEYSLNGGVAWTALAATQLVNLTNSNTTTSTNIALGFTLASPVSVDLAADDFRIRYTVLNDAVNAGAYNGITSIVFDGAVVPEPSAALLGGLGLLGLLRRRRA